MHSSLTTAAGAGTIPIDTRWEMMMSKLLRRIFYALRHRKLEADLADEIEFHRQMKQQELQDALRYE